MLGSGSFFRFSFRYPKNEVGAWTFAMAYKPPGPMRTGALQQLLLDACQGPDVPDAVVLVGLKEDESGKLLETLTSDSMTTARQRIAGRIALLYVGVSLRTGNVELKILDEKFKSKRHDFHAALKLGAAAWFGLGLAAALPRDDVVLSAPSGYAYQKPSGSRSSVFLKPDLALKSSASVGFVALVVFLRLYSGNLERLAQLETVFVDTMAISPVAYGLKDLMAVCEHSRPFVIESFHSYGGFDEVARPLAGTSLCLISASASMSLHKKWLLEKQVQSFEVLTLVTLSAEKTEVDGALLVIADDGAKNDAASDAPFSIRIKGETFLPESEAAKRVLLRETAHRCDGETKWFYELAGKEVFDLYRRPPVASSKPRALFVDGLKLLEQVEFARWLKEQSLRRIKASTRVIVHQDDEPSRLLAGQVQQIASKELGLATVRLIPQSRLADETLAREDGVIVCGAVVGKGSLLLEISRTLRDKHSGPRLYLVGFQVTEVREEALSLKQNLQHDKVVQHDYVCFGTAAVGRQIQASFGQEVSRYRFAGAEAEDYPGVLGSRLLALGDVSRIADLGLLPHGDGVSDSLRLRETFAFWPEDYVAGPHHAEVVATISVILQRAREDRRVAEADRLASATYRHVVLHPENFSRFNDGIVQAALLRAAQPSELDYRDDYAGSDFLKGLILRSLNRADDEAGEGILEMLLALASGRMQLVQSHFKEVVAAATTNTRLGAPLRWAINFILDPRPPARADADKLSI